ncbi:hypothetical protein DSO57_1024751 [Entomophthora muscae]|uniref:Uncharacterized protein n=1 Tax=Entomophthora muscae TaxID=34485 RepID=A0ACC2S4I4_9FUNG|nr:hypothetical protein DSO57_1024751 [Entomophthora muscae]
MEGTQQQTTIAPVVRRSCSCPHGSKNRLSTTQVPTQEGGGRGVFHSDAALTQPVQGAQAARVQSINPWVPKLTRKPTKVTTTKTVRNKELELTLYVFDVVYRQELVPSAIVVNCAINAILICPSNIDSCKDLTGFAFKFGNSLLSANGSGSISTHSGLLYMSVVDPGMTSSQSDPLSHSVFRLSDHCLLSTI